MEDGGVLGGGVEALDVQGHQGDVALDLVQTLAHHLEICADLIQMASILDHSKCFEYQQVSLNAKSEKSLML